MIQLLEVKLAPMGSGSFSKNENNIRM